jgi:hypothetical protein
VAAALGDKRHREVGGEAGRERKKKKREVDWERGKEGKKKRRLGGGEEDKKKKRLGGWLFVCLCVKSKEIWEHELAMLEVGSWRRKGRVVGEGGINSMEEWGQQSR